MQWLRADDLRAVIDVANARLAGPARRSPTLPLMLIRWYAQPMSGTHTVTMGDRGRLVVPAEVRERAGLDAGTSLILLETPGGIVLLTRDQLRTRVRDELAGLDLVSELLADRRRAAADEDAA